MRFSQIVNETSAGATGSGSVATVSSPLGATQSRGNPSIYGGQKVGNLLKGKKTSKPFANSLSEGKMSQVADDLEELSDKEFLEQYGETKKEMRQGLKNEPQKKQKEKPAEKVEEARLEEEDKIIPVGKGKKLKTGLHGKADEPKFKGLKPPFKSQGVFVADKRGNKVCDCENDIVAQQVAKALTAYAIANEVKLQGAGALAGGLQYESEEVEEGKKVERMKSHIEKSERKLGKSKDEAEDIAWATLNKRGYLDNKNKKKGK